MLTGRLISSEVSPRTTPSEITEAVYAMQDGEFQVVQTQFGWHVLQRLAPATLVEVEAEVEAEIRENLLLVQKGNAGQAWLVELRNAAQVTLTDGHGVWNTNFGSVVTPDFTG